MNVLVVASAAKTLLVEYAPLLSAIKKAGHEVCVLVPAPDIEDMEAASQLNVRILGYAPASGAIPTTTADALPNIGTGPASVCGMRSFFSLWRGILRFQAETVLICGTSSVVPATMAALCAGVRHTLSLLPDAYPFSAPPTFWRRPMRILQGLCFRLACTANRSVIFLNTGTQAALTNGRFPLIPRGVRSLLLDGPGVDGKQFPSSVPVPVSPDLPESLEFLCLAHLTRDAGVEDFAEAARTVRTDYPDAHFRLLVEPAPSGPPISASDLSLWRTWMEIIPTGKLSRAALREAITRAAAFVHVSRQDTPPHTALCALSSGRPILATTLSPCRALVIAEENGSVTPSGNAKALADEMERLLREPEWLSAAGAASRRLAVKRFDAATASRALLTEAHLAHISPETPLPQTLLGAGIKRALDLLIAVPAAILLLPVMLIVAWLVRRSISRDIFFLQERPGRHGKLFRIIKFKTMSDACDSHGVPLPDAERMTPLGTKLRALSLDELPELWNVIRGDMSLVGPRPLLPRYLSRYSPRQARRHEVRPGITGWAQVSGRNAASWEDRLEKDVWYVDNHSLWLDLRILFRTVWQVLRRDGITSEGHATCAEFMGSAAPSAPPQAPSDNTTTRPLPNNQADDTKVPSSEPPQVR